MKTITVLIALLFTSQFIQAQDTTKTNQLAAKPIMYHVELNDGNAFTGTLIRENETEMVLKTSVGEVTLKKSNIKKIREINQDDFKSGSYWFENPHDTRYVVGPSAFGLKKGEGYYQNMYLFIHSFNVGITKNISIGGGTEIASVIFAGEAPNITFLTPKISFELSKQLHLATGVLYLHTGFGSSAANYGIGYGLATLGNRNTNLTFGIGWGYHSYMRSTQQYNPTTNVYTYNSYRDKGISPNPIITFSGMARTGKKFSLITENWIYPINKTIYNGSTGSSYVKSEYDFIVSYGARFMGESMAIDFGFMNSPEWSNWIKIGIPYIDFVVKFGGNKSNKKKKK